MKNIVYNKKNIIQAFKANAFLNSALKKDKTLLFISFAPLREEKDVPYLLNIPHPTKI